MPMSEPKIRVVFRPPAATLLAVDDVADANDWTEAAHFRRAERRNEEVVYELPDGETVVRGIDDQFVAVVFAHITGPKREEAERTLRAAGEAMDDALLWQWAESPVPKERAFALRAFAAISDETADPRVVALYSNAVKDENPEVRTALLEAVGRAAWRELWPVVDELARSGTAEAAVLKAAYERHVPRSSAS
jgi:hypothetical protein